MSRKTTMIAAIREAIDEEMLRDENVIVLGEDIGELGVPSARVSACWTSTVPTALSPPLSANGASPASA